MSEILLKIGLQFFSLKEELKKETEELTNKNNEIENITNTFTPTYTAPTAPVKSGFDEWFKLNGGVDEQGYYAKYDLDPDRDFQNTVNTLNYEYQTSMANYGEQAEKMYQMGLQNSGVSDIFQANAFSAYLGNMNQAAADRITARKRNKAAYNDYVLGKKSEYEQYSNAWDADMDTRLNAAMSYALQNYNGYNVDDVKQMLAASGYYQDTIDQVAQRLGAIDPTKLRSQTSMQIADTIFNTLLPNYSGSEEDKATIRNILGNTVNSDALENAFVMADARVGSMKDAKTADAWNAISGLLSADSSNEYIKLQLQNAGFDATDELVASMRAKLDQTIDVVEKEEQAVIDTTAKEIVTDIETKLTNKSNSNNGVLTFADREAAINEIETAMGGVTSDASNEAIEKYKQENADMVALFMNGTNNINDANLYLTGFLSAEDISNWDSLDNDGKRKAIVEAAVGAGTDKISADNRQKIVADYVGSKIKDIISTDKGNAKASGLADAGDLVAYVKGLGLGSATEKELIKNIAEQMKFEIKGEQINWYGAVEGAEATFRGVREKGNKVTDSNILTKLGDVTGSKIKTYKTVNGVLYEVVPKTSYTEAYWVELKPENLEIVGDGHTNTDDQRKGIYNLLIVLLEMKQDSGYVKGKLPSDTTVTPAGDSTAGAINDVNNESGGRTKDFSTTNK